EGVSFAIILSNLLVPMIEKYTVPNAFGVVKTKPEKEAK
ncbi:Na+-transporting NADH:ubiquinone oxidoreductase subunit D, partial [Soehngenia saccharolytica]